MAKNKVKPHGNKNENHYKKPNNNLFKSKNTSDNLNNSNLSHSEKKNYNGTSKFKNGKVDKNKYKQNKQFGGKIRNNQVGVQQENVPSDQKKPFDKKTWRLKKYSKKYKLDQWEEKRKKAMLTEYYKQIKNDDVKFDVKKIYDEHFDSDEERETNAKINYVSNPNLNEILGKDEIVCEKENVSNNDEVKTPNKKLSAYHRAQLEYQRIQDEKKQKREDFLRQKAEKEEALKKYKKNKMEKYKKLSKKTRKGQPIMKDRMEMLLEKIQSTSV